MTRSFTGRVMKSSGLHAVVILFLACFGITSAPHPAFADLIEDPTQQAAAPAVTAAQAQSRNEKMSGSMQDNNVTGAVSFFERNAPLSSAAPAQRLDGPIQDVTVLGPNYYDIKEYRRLPDGSRGEMLSHNTQRQISQNTNGISYEFKIFDVTTGQVTHWYETSPQQGGKTDFKEFAVTPNGSKGSLMTHMLIAQGNSSVALTLYDPVSNAVTEFADMTYSYGADGFSTDYKFYSVNAARNTKGDLVRHIQITDNGVTTTTRDFDLVSNQVMSLMEETPLGAGTSELKIYSVNAAGQKGDLLERYQKLKQAYNQYRFTECALEGDCGNSVNAWEVTQLGPDKLQIKEFFAGMLVSQAIEEQLGPDHFLITAFEGGVPVLIQESQRINAQKVDYKMFKINSRGQKGDLSMHFAIENLPADPGHQHIMMTVYQGAGNSITRFDEYDSSYNFAAHQSRVEIKSYNRNAGGNPGTLLSHSIEENLDTHSPIPQMRYTVYNAATNRVVSITEVTEFSEFRKENREYKVNSDGTRGDLLSRRIQEQIDTDPSTPGMQGLKYDEIEFNPVTGAVQKHITQEKLANGLILVTTFDPVTGKVTGTQTSRVLIYDINIRKQTPGIAVAGSDFDRFIRLMGGIELVAIQIYQP